MHKLYRDNKNQELKEGFYEDKHGKIIYFLGKYDHLGLALFERDSSTVQLIPKITSHLKYINNPINYLTIKKRDLDWMEQKLSQLEQETNNFTSSSQSLPKSTEKSREYETPEEEIEGDGLGFLV